MRNCSFILRLKYTAARTMKGTMVNIIKVSHTLTPHRMIKEPIILMPAMKNSSGQWWANSVTSNRSVVMRVIIWATLVLSK